MQLAEHVKDLAAQGTARLLELFEQFAIDVPFAGFFRDQVPKMADLRLADAVNTAKPLFQPVRIPWQVVVHHQVGALEVDALARGIRREQT